MLLIFIHLPKLLKIKTVFLYRAGNRTKDGPLRFSWFLYRKQKYHLPPPSPVPPAGVYEFPVRGWRKDGHIPRQNGYNCIHVRGRRSRVNEKH